MQGKSTDPTVRKLTVPISLLEHAFRNCYLNELRLYLYLKAISDGRIVQVSSKMRYLHKPLGFKQNRKIKEIYNKCLTLNLIGFDSQGDVAFIRSYRDILKFYGLKGKSAVELNACFDKKKFAAWVFAALILRRIFWLERKEKKRVLTKGPRTFQRPSLPDAKAQGLPLRYIEKWLGISYGKAQSLKMQANKYGFIKVKPQFQRLEIKLRNQITKRTEVYSAVADLPVIYHVYPHLKGRVRIFRNHNVSVPFIRVNDAILSAMKFNKKRSCSKI